jgi:putative FmdB family regulatory protein
MGDEFRTVHKVPQGRLHPYNECISSAWAVAEGASAADAEGVMPIFEYICKDCGNKFEAIVYGSKQSECPACNSTELEQQLSTFAAHGTDKSSASAPKLPCGMPGGSCGGGGCGMN